MNEELSRGAKFNLAIGAIAVTLTGFAADNPLDKVAGRTNGWLNDALMAATIGAWAVFALRVIWWLFGRCNLKVPQEP